MFRTVGLGFVSGCCVQRHQVHGACETPHRGTPLTVHYPIRESSCWIEGGETLETAKNHCLVYNNPWADAVMPRGGKLLLHLETPWRTVTRQRDRELSGAAFSGEEREVMGDVGPHCDV